VTQSVPVVPVEDAPIERRAGADYAVLAIVCASAIVAGTIEVLLIPLHIGGTALPITVLFGILTGLVLPRLGLWLTQTMAGGVLPLACWLIAVLGVAFYPRPEGDVLVLGGKSSQQWVLFAMIVAGALAGFRTILRGAETLAPPRTAAEQAVPPPVSR
jgi:hypothetical protein